MDYRVPQDMVSTYELTNFKHDLSPLSAIVSIGA